jgi:hypothetical protein
MSSSHAPSLKFCAKNAHRTIVQPSPERHDDALGLLGLGLVAAGQQHQPADAGVLGQFG